MERTFVENHIEIDKVPKNTKKITGTRFASILGLNAWKTPFEVWCEITRVYEKPFEDTKYTLAGKVLEPKIIDYLNKYYFMDSVKSPTDIYGKDYFKKTWGDFYPDNKVFGGMWDALVYDEGKPTNVIEIKTTKRVEDWEDGKAPIYYSLQAALYAYLLGVNDVTMVVVFLEDKDYEHPENVVISKDNLMVDYFKLDERFPNFVMDYLQPAADWWANQVSTGISPDFDEKADADILKELRNNHFEKLDTDIESILKEAEKLNDEIESIESKIKEKKDRLEELKKGIKAFATDKFRDDDNKVTLTYGNTDWTVSKINSTRVDTTALKKDGLYEKYSKTSETIKLTNSKKEK